MAPFPTHSPKGVISRGYVCLLATLFGTFFVEILTQKDNKHLATAEKAH